MDDDKIEAIGKALRSDDHRTRAINIIGKIDPLPEYLVESWIDDVVFALENENNPFDQRQIFRELVRMAKAYPGKATTAVPVVTRELNEEIYNSQGKELESNKRVDWSTSILQIALEEIDPTDCFPSLSPDDLDNFLEYGEITQRSLGYRLLGRRANPTAIEKLVEERPYELDSVLESREIALQEAVRLVASSLGGNDCLSTGEAIVSFSKLYTSGAIAESDAVNQIQNLSLASLQVEGEDLERVRAATKRIAEKNEEVARPIAEKSLTLLETDLVDHNSAWDILKGVAESAPEVISDNSERLSRLIDTSNPSTLSEVLDVISFTSRSGTIQVYHTIAERAFTILEDSEDRDEAWRLLSRVSKRAPEAILRRSERLVELIDSGELADAVEGLDVVSTIGNRRSTLPADLGKVALRALESDDQSVVIAAIEAVSAAGFYPPPPRLKQLAVEDNRVAEEASEALSELSQRTDDGSSSLTQTFRMRGPEISLFDGTEAEPHLQRRT
jgi:hypothetical protein